jgi:hypothetical protein
MAAIVSAMSRSSRRLSLACLTLALVAACGGATWDKPGTTQDVVQKDGEDCWEKARIQARSYTSPATGGVAVGAPADRPVGRAMDEGAAFQDCMRAKGYSEKR